MAPGVETCKTEVLNSSHMAEQSTEGRVGFTRCHRLLISWRTPSSDEQKIMASDGDASNSSGFLNSGCVGAGHSNRRETWSTRRYYSDPWILNAEQQRLGRFPEGVLVVCSPWSALDDNDSVFFISSSNSSSIYLVVLCVLKSWMWSWGYSSVGRMLA